VATTGKQDSVVRRLGGVRAKVKHKKSNGVGGGTAGAGDHAPSAKKIGDGAMFVEHVRANYGKVLGMTKETQKKRTHENMQKINDEMRKKEQGLTTGEKIAKSLDKIKEKNYVNCIQDAFFLPEIENDCLFWTRRMDLYQGARLLDIPDEVLIA